jgi:hypothetical protein
LCQADRGINLPAAKVPEASTVDQERCHRKYERRSDASTVQVPARLQKTCRIGAFHFCNPDLLALFVAVAFHEQPTSNFTTTQTKASSTASANSRRCRLQYPLISPSITDSISYPHPIPADRCICGIISDHYIVSRQSSILLYVGKEEKGLRLG